MDVMDVMHLLRHLLYSHLVRLAMGQPCRCRRRRDVLIETTRLRLSRMETDVFVSSLPVYNAVCKCAHPSSRQCEIPCILMPVPQLILLVLVLECYVAMRENPLMLVMSSSSLRGISMGRCDPRSMDLDRCGRASPSNQTHGPRPPSSDGALCLFHFLRLR
jgi:hypothetical protein